MKCPYCGSEDTIRIFSIDRMPTMLGACSISLLRHVKVLPFTAHLCKNCLLGFNSSKLDRMELQFIYDNYIYISPFAGIGRTKYEPILEIIKKWCSYNDKIVEIGCSEGYLLYKLRELGFKNLVGVEPSPQADIGISYGLNIIKSYYDGSIFLEGSVDCFVMSHVFEHFEDPFSILRFIKHQLSEMGKIIIEVPYFTGFYHKHLFFYNISFLQRLFRDVGLKIVYGEISNDALRIIAVHRERDIYADFELENETLDYIQKKAFDEYNTFKENVKKINDYFKSVSNLVWWGAGSSSVILINQLEPEIINQRDILVVDGDKNKWYCYIPGTNIQVKPYTDINQKKIDLLIIASSFYKEILQTIKTLDVQIGKVVIFY